MPKPKNLSAYPREYFQLLEKAIREPVELALVNKKEAESLRFDLYGFRSALINDSEAEPELAIMADGLEFLVQENKLKIQMRDHAPRLSAIREALGD